MTNDLKQSGFAHLLLIVAVLGLMGLMAVSNVEMMHQLTAPQSAVQGVLIAKGGEDSRNSDSGGSSGRSADSESHISTSNSTEPVRTPQDVGRGGGLENTDQNRGNPPIKVKRLEFNDHTSTSSSKNHQESGNHDGEHNNVDDQVQNQIGDHNVNQINFKNNGHKLEIETKDATGSAHKLTETEATGSGKFRIKLASASAKLKDVELEENDNGLRLISKGESVDIHFPISLDKTTGELIVQTGNGSKVIRVLPDQAAEIAKNAGVQTKLSNLELQQNGNTLVFDFKGQRVVSVLGLIPLVTNLDVQVDVQSGAVTVSQPWWANLFR